MSVRLDIFETNIPQLNRTRTIRVLLPSDYDSSHHAYPVIYAMDGQNLFQKETFFSGDWGMMKTMTKSPKNQNAIIVGVDNGGDLRMSEYAPYPTTKGNGEGKAFISFISDTLKPLIDSKYKTLSDRTHTSILGSSLGGLISFYGGLVRPDIFGNVCVFSPAFWFNPNVLKLPETANTLRSRFYVVGSKNESRYMSDTLQQTYWALKNNGWSETDFTVIVRDKGKHNENFWSKEFKLLLPWLFP